MTASVPQNFIRLSRKSEVICIGKNSKLALGTSSLMKNSQRWSFFLAYRVFKCMLEKRRRKSTDTVRETSFDVVYYLNGTAWWRQYSPDIEVNVSDPELMRRSLEHMEQRCQENSDAFSDLTSTCCSADSGAEARPDFFIYRQPVLNRTT